MNRRFVVFFILIVFLLAVDWYVYTIIDSEFNFAIPVFTVSYIGLTAVFLIYLFYIIQGEFWNRREVRYQRVLYSFMGLLILLYIPKLISAVLFFVNDLIEGILNLISNIKSLEVFIWAGIFLGISAFVLILYGIIVGKYNFSVERFNLSFKTLPQEWDGVKILHFSDLHIGSWSGRKEQLKEAVHLMNKQEPDLILFTGDLINNFAEEVTEFKPILKQLNAKLGKYSILGNHDYGDYFQWPSKEEKEKNLEDLINVHQELGFHLLLNSSAILEKNNSRIGIVGVENWGLPPFHQNGDLNEAIKTLDKETNFNILLTHDPSHWKQQVVERDDIDLTLSGHTHGMQFGVFTKYLKWSPAKWKYPEWGGLYTYKKHKLYVNTGLGFIGFPGRIGMRPRITVIKLKRK